MALIADVILGLTYKYNCYFVSNIYDIHVEGHKTSGLLLVWLKIQTYAN